MGAIPSLYFKLIKIVLIGVMILGIIVLFSHMTAKFGFEKIKHEAKMERQEMTAKEYAKYVANTSNTSVTSLTRDILLREGDTVVIWPYEFVYVLYNETGGKAIVSIINKKYGAVTYELCTNGNCPAKTPVSLQYYDETTETEYVLSGYLKIENAKYIVNVNGKNIANYEVPVIVGKIHLDVITTKKK